LSMALGAGETTLLKLTTAYAELVNGGPRIVPSLIDRVQDRQGHTIFRHDNRPCPACTSPAYMGQNMPARHAMRPQTIGPVTASQVVSMREGAVLRGTARPMRSLGTRLAGKTGTTNGGRDTWRLGCSREAAGGVLTGDDMPRAMGNRETG